MSQVAQAQPLQRATPSWSPRQLPLPPEAVPPDPRIEVPLDEVVFRRVHGAHDLQRVAHLRDAIALPPGVRDAPAFVRLEKKRDEQGVVGAFECRGAVFGTVRVLPMNRGLAPCDDVLDRQPDLPAGIRDHAWEVGRLVLAPDYRAGPELLRRCLALTLLDMVEHAPVQNIFASCRPVLARLYRRFGYSVLVKDVAASADADPYTLIHGDVAAVLRAVCDSQPAHGMMALQ